MVGPTSVGAAIIGVRRQAAPVRVKTWPECDQLVLCKLLTASSGASAAHSAEATKGAARRVPTAPGIPDHHGHHPTRPRPSTDRDHLIGRQEVVELSASDSTIVSEDLTSPPA